MSQLSPDVDLWTVPCGPPPEGVISNFHKRSPLMGLTIAIVVVVSSLMVATMTLRFWTKYRGRESWKSDDFFTIATFVFTVTQGVMQVFQTKNLGFEAWDIPLGFLLSRWPRRMLIATTVIGQLMMFLGKCCILTWYYHVFGFVTRVRYQIYGAHFLALSLIVSSILMPIWIGPKAWKGSVPKGSESSKLTIAVGVVKLVTDLVILYIPIPVVLNMKLSRRKKIGVLATFLTGTVAIVADVVDLYFRIEFFKGKRPFILGIYIPLCSLVEAGISVIVSSMPFATKVWKRHIVGSPLYNVVRSKFPESKTSIIQSVPADLKLAKEKAYRKQRRGPYSIPTFFTTSHSAMQTAPIEHRGDVIMKPVDVQVVEDCRVSIGEAYSCRDASSPGLHGGHHC